MCNEFQRRNKFLIACYSNNIEEVKTLELPDFKFLNNVLIDMCGVGLLNIAKYIYNHEDRKDYDDEITYDDAVIESCKNGQLHILQWLLDIPLTYTHSFTRAFTTTCEYGHLHIAQLLYNQDEDIIRFAPDAFIEACKNGHLNIAKWLIDNHYKSSGFIHFKSYSNFKVEIKELLIGANLVHPRQLNTADLEHYLTYTDGLVPADFNHPNTRKRGQHTKPAPKYFFFEFDI